MFSDLDDFVSDHGRPIIESIEATEIGQMEDFDNGQGESSESMNNNQAPQEGTGARQGPSPTQVDLANSDESDYRGQSGLAKKVTGTPTVRRKANGATKVSVASEDENEPYSRQLPPSYQIQSRADGEFSSAGTNSTDSIKARSQLKNVAQDKQKSRKRRPSVEPEPEAVELRPKKKKTKTSVTRAYLDVLHEDIEHAASHGPSSDHERLDKRVALPSSQIGVTFWTSTEKESFFEALGRLGRDDTAGIAGRIHTKGEMEVRQYMKLLQDALNYRRQQNQLDSLGLEDFPSAVEFSHECCQALDEVADNIAKRQERATIDTEEHDHGSDWLVSLENCKRQREDAGDDFSKPAGVFRTTEWLSLSKNFFMNAPAAEGNWQSVDGNAPSIRLKTLNDFHSLALTLTRRLVAASHYMATTRIRAESGYNRRQVREFVKEKDVRAAALSLGLATQKPLLTGCIKRLGLSVYEKPPKPDEDSDLEPMSVTEVEDALSVDGLRNVSRIRHQMDRIALSDDEKAVSDSSLGSDVESDQDRTSGSAEDAADSGEEEEIKAEADEALLYSAIDPPQTKRDREALYRRIKAEREQERHADAVDVQRSYHEEISMWKLLGQQPPKSLVDPGSPPSGRRLNLSVDVDRSVGGDWRAKTRAVSEWEARYMAIN